MSELVFGLSPQMPTAVIAEALRASFDVTAVSWQWQDDEATMGFEGFPLPAGLDEAFWSVATNPEIVNDHPLLHWFATTSDPRPQSTGRVPSRMAPAGWYSVADVELRRVGCEQQLSIPYRLGRFQHRAFLLSRTGTDFSDDDLQVARHLQPAFYALDKQVGVLAELSSRDQTGAPAGDHGLLTGREVAVLSLLTAGHTASGIGHRLGVSPRTAEKHLEHIYRKLHVADRVGAIRAADEIGQTPQWRGR